MSGISSLNARYRRLKQWNLMHAILETFHQSVSAFRVYHGSNERFLEKGAARKRLEEPVYFAVHRDYAEWYRHGTGQLLRAIVPLDRIMDFGSFYDSDRSGEFVLEPGYFYEMEDMANPGKSTAGLEEKPLMGILRLLDEAMPQGSGVLVIEAGVISRRMGLAEFVARVPRRLGDRIILFGADSAEAKEIAARNGIAVVDSDKLSDLAFQLMVLGDEADRVGYLGNPVAAAALSGMLPMKVTPLNPKTTLDKLLRTLGYAEPVLDAINAAGAEELFARARAA